MGIGISAIDMDDARSFIEDAISNRKKIYISVCPVSTIMECRRNKKILRSVNSADLVTPDGMPIVWIGRVFGHRNIRRVYGPELMQEICAVSARNGYRHYLYGSSPDVLNRLNENLIRRYPGIDILGIFSPPFRRLTKEEDDRVVNELNRLNLHIVWVGLGSPKQDLWMYEHRDKIDAPVMIGVGAAFDFLAGTKPQAPRWIRNNGFEWLFRLATEPKRLWRRYIVDNSLFMSYLIPELLSRAFGHRGKNGTDSDIKRKQP
jgi:N-acetylglucosaminyldiphosphoundecaprenol N-acetyl-beta-D-mannosaminyltransferase